MMLVKTLTKKLPTRNVLATAPKDHGISKVCSRVANGEVDWHAYGPEAVFYGYTGARISCASLQRGLSAKACQGLARKGVNGEAATY